MHISEVEKYRKEKDRLMRGDYQAVARSDKNDTYGIETKSPDDDNKDMFGGMHGVDPNSHGVENQ